MSGLILSLRVWVCNVATTSIPVVKKAKYPGLETKDSAFSQAHLNANLKDEMDPIHHM